MGRFIFWFDKLYFWERNFNFYFDKLYFWEPTSNLPYDSSTHSVSFELVAENLPNNGITTQVDYNDTQVDYNATNLGAMEIFDPAG
jgi:hypothetical protein